MYNFKIFWLKSSNLLNMFEHTFGYKVTCGCLKDSFEY